MELSFVLGLIGSIILLIGAIYPIEKTGKPSKSIKNRCFALGASIMLLYAIAGYFAWWPVFYIYLELLIMVACVLMLLGTDDRRDVGIIGGLGIALLIWSRFLFNWPSMLLFILAFIILGLGYAFDMHSVRRYLGLTIGGALIALSSYLDASRIFFWLNVFFALFSLYYTITLLLPHKKHIKKRR